MLRSKNIHGTFLGVLVILKNNKCSNKKAFDIRGVLEKKVQF